MSEEAVIASPQSGDKRGRDDLDSSTASSQDGNAPKRRPLQMPPNTPDWAQILFEEMYERIYSLETKITDSIHSVNFAVNTAKSAKAESAKVKQLIQKQGEELTELKAEIAQLRLENKQTREKMTRLEDHSRRDNLLFYGFDEQPGETEADCRQKVYKLLVTKMQFIPQEVDEMKVVRCHRKGPYMQGRSRPIIIKMHWYADRQAIWARKGALKESPYFINEDYSDVTENKRRQLYPVLKAAKSNPWYRDNAFINVDRLILRGRSYTVDQLKDLPGDINPAQIATEFRPNMVKFFRKESPLSNFHPCPIKIDNKNYFCTEQYYQYKKCEFFDDDEAGAKVMAATTAFKCYQAGSAVRNYDQTRWRQQCDAVMKQALEVKFRKPNMKEFLLSTESKIIAECNGKDMYWGIGYYSNNPLSNSKDTWRGQNRLGTLLMQVRDQIRS